MGTLAHAAEKWEAALRQGDAQIKKFEAYPDFI
jgi:hypothetical protein